MFNEYISYGRVRGKLGKEYERIFADIFDQDSDFEEFDSEKAYRKSNKKKKTKAKSYYDEKTDERVDYEYQSPNQKR